MINIQELIHLLNSYPFYGVDESIDIAKGKNKYPQSMREYKNYFKRNKK